MCCSVAEDYNRSAAFTILNGISTKSAPLERSFSLKGDDNTNKGCFGRKNYSGNLEILQGIGKPEKFSGKYTDIFRTLSNNLFRSINSRLDIACYKTVCVLRNNCILCNLTLVKQFNFP